MSAEARLPPPGPEAQLRFLRDLQRILDEGSFVATYKFALIHALADLAVERGDDSGATLTLPTRDIAERFIHLYWRQVAPFPGAAQAALLSQNTGRQAAIVNRVAEARARYGDSLADVRGDPGRWKALVREVDRTVRVMPLWRLQMVGREVQEVLYRQDQGARQVTLLPGIAACFRAFHPLVLDLVEGAWSHFVRRTNGGGSDVDHFIPWRRYPTDLGHNLVLAHATCNRQKSDRLAAEPHLERWAERNRTHGQTMAAKFDERRVRHDLEASRRIARWAYGHTAGLGGQVWLRGKETSPLGPGWEGLLGAG